MIARTRLAAIVLAAGCHQPAAQVGQPDADTTADAPGLVDGASASSPRLLAPMSTTTSASRRPTLHWLSGAGSPSVDLCADRACSQPLAIATTITGSTAIPTGDLPAGWIYWRVRDGAATSATWQLWIGAGAGSIFDVNGDGFPDLLIGAGGADRAHIYLGGATGIGFERLDIDSPDGVNTGFGQTAANVGDVNGDGFPDFVVGAWAVGGSVGAAHLYLGGPDLDPSAWNGAGASRRIDLASPGGMFGEFGEMLSAAGDVDGDGYADFVIVSPGILYEEGPAHLYRGEAIPVSTDYDGTTPTMRIDILDSDGAGHGFWAAAAIGDINGDGFGDFALGSLSGESDDSASYVHVYVGGPELAAASWNGVTAPQRIDLLTPFGADAFGGEFGDAIAGVGDIDGDGYDDFIATAPWSAAGTALLLLGGSTPTAADWLAMPTSAHRVEVSCPSDDDFFGLTAASIGDIDGDGHPDFALAGAADFDLANPGVVHLFVGGGSPATASWNGDSATQRIDLLSVGGANTYFGHSVGELGDLNGDGYADFGVGAIGGNGAAYLYLGTSTPATAGWTGATPAARLDIANPDGAGAGFGQAIE